MRTFLLLALVALLAAAPSAAQSQTAMSAVPTMGSGPHGYDFLIGTWSCVNGAEYTPISGPRSTTERFTLSGQNGAIFIRTTGNNFDVSGYIAYNARTRTWSNPVAYADGSNSTETSKAGGSKTVWYGTYSDFITGKSTDIRDTYTLTARGRFTDLGESKSGPFWKKTYFTTCTKF